MTNSMIWIVATLTLLFCLSYAVYRTARTEATGFKALLAWVSFAILDAMAVVAWIIWAYTR
jgi:hypothetical protein